MGRLLSLVRTAFAATAVCLIAAPTGAQGLRALDTSDAARGWEAIGRLDSGISFCSATLIAPDLVLTAAHCLFDGDGNRIEDERFIFSASLRNGRAEAYRNISQSHMPADYPGPYNGSGSETIAYDIALLQLDHPIPEQTVTPIALGAQGRARDLVTVVSYGRDRETMASIEEGCEILADDGRVHILSCNVVSGSSGAPILRVENGAVEVIAVVSALAEWNGGPVSVAVAAEDLVPDLIRQTTQAPIVFERMPQGVRSLSAGSGERSDIGARFIRP